MIPEAAVIYLDLTNKIPMRKPLREALVEECKQSERMYKLTKSSLIFHPF